MSSMRAGSDVANLPQDSDYLADHVGRSPGVEQVIGQLDPGLQRGPDLREQLAELLAGSGVGPAARVVPLAREIDGLPGRDLDAVQAESPSRPHRRCASGSPCHARISSRPSRRSRTVSAGATGSMDSSRPTASRAQAAQVRGPGIGISLPHSADERSVMSTRIHGRRVRTGRTSSLSRSSVRANGNGGRDVSLPPPLPPPPVSTRHLGTP